MFRSSFGERIGLGHNEFQTHNGRNRIELSLIQLHKKETTLYEEFNCYSIATRKFMCPPPQSDEREVSKCLDQVLEGE